MKHAKQSIVFLSALGVVTSFYAHILAQPSDYSSDAVSDQVTYITRGDISPSNNAAYTISRPGVYQLTSAKTASGIPNISITANNVVLDLGGNTLTGGTNGIQVTGTNVVIANGTITGMAQNGVLIQGNGCRIENCDFVSCTTGITLQNANECVIEKCRARNMTQAGFSLQSTWTSSVSECEISGINGIGSVYGVLAKNGGGNSISQCVIKDLQTNSSTVGAEVAGIALDNEVASGVQDNQIGAVVSLTTTAAAYGVLTRMLVVKSAVKIPDQPLLSGTNAQVAFDGSGNAFSVWQQGTTTQVYSAQYARGLDWSLTSTLPGQNPILPATFPQIAVDQTGNAIVIWIQSDGIRTQMYWARYSAASLAWSTAVKIPGQITTSPQSSQIAMDQEGNAIAVWTQNGKIYWSRYSVISLAWTNASLIPGQTAGSIISDIAVDKAGNATVVFIHNDGVANKVYWSKYTVTSALWTTAAKIPNQPAAAATVPQVAVDLEGNAIAVWVQSDGVANKVYWSHYTAMSAVWTDAAQIPNQPAVAATTPQVAVDQRGTAVALWVQDSRLYWSRYSATGAVWTDAAQLPGQSATPSAPQLAMDQAGNAMAIMIYSSRVRWSRYTESLGWTSVALIPGQPSASAGVPQVSVDTFGNALFVWTQSDGTRNQIYWSRYSIGTGWVTGTTVVGVSSLDGDGAGISAPNIYVADNVVHDSDIPFAGILTEFIDSQANARGVDNIDTSLTTPDTIAVMHDDQLPTIESQLDLVSDNVFTVDSKLDVLAQCESTVVATAGTLSTDYGLYCLGANITGQLSITGTGIDLDLAGRFINANSGANGLVISGDDVSVHNGTVRNASASGVKITGNNCLLDTIVSYGNVTGFELSNADRNILTNCSAINNTQEGYLLSSSDYNTLTNCRAVNTSGSGLSAGIKTTGGVGNRFDGCTVNGVASSAGEAYGVLALGEQKTGVVACAVNGVRGTLYTGGVSIMGDYVRTPAVSDFTLAQQLYARHLDWLNTPVGSYIVSSDDWSAGSRRLFVSGFSPASGFGSTVSTTLFSSWMYDVDWLTWQGNYYIASSGDNGAGNVIVSQYNPAANTLSSVATYVYHATEGATGIDWFISGTVPYLACSGFNPANEFGVLRFGGTSLVAANFVNMATTQLTVQAHDYKGRWLIATGGERDSATGNILYVYEFNNPQGSEALTFKTSFTSVTIASTRDLAWLEYDGQHYLAMASQYTAGQPTVRVLKYDETITPTLIQIAASNYAADAHGVDWLVTGSTIYLALGGQLFLQTVKIFTFDPYTSQLTSFLNYNDLRNVGKVQWNRHPLYPDQVLLAAGSTAYIDPGIRVLGFALNNQSQLCYISDTLVSDVIGGSGIVVDTLTNAATDNRVYNCQDGLVEVIQTQHPVTEFDTSNWQVPHA